MSEMLSAEEVKRVAEIEARVNSTSPDYWNASTMNLPKGRDERIRIEAHPYLDLVCTVEYQREEAQEWRNAQFIAHAPQDIRDLLALVRRFAPQGGAPAAGEEG